MLRFLSALALFGGAFLVPIQAQVYTIQPRPITVSNKPRGGFSLSVRLGGSVNVTFENVGAVASRRDIGDTTSRRTRVYDDGLVAIDGRVPGAGSAGDDGMTNTWSYNYDSQITEDENIAFHQYSTSSNNLDLQAESGDTAGVDMQYDMVIGASGAAVSDRARAFSWGLMAGGIFSPINANTRQQIRANLVTVTDIYSLEGASVPRSDPDLPGYSAPSTTTVTGTGPNGETVQFPIDNTTLLTSRPFSRSAPSITEDAAVVDGFWQVKGAYYSLRVGTWARWHFTRSLSLRASIGGTFSFLGVNMEHDELVSGIEALVPLRGGVLTTPDKQERWGVYGAIDAEWWISDRTGFFIGATYEDAGDDVVLRTGDPANGGRTAVVELPNGSGFRAGISVLF